jgi:hypothetical protein
VPTDELDTRRQRPIAATMVAGEVDFFVAVRCSPEWARGI